MTRPEDGPRLSRRPEHSGAAPLDGAWWPRSADPTAELPGLILALDEWHGRVSRLMLGTAGWDASRPSRLKVDSPAGSRVVRLGWFATMPTGLITAIPAAGERTDLVTIPPGTGEREAVAAMEQAAQAGNRDHAPAILAAIAAPGTVAGEVPEHTRRDRPSLAEGTGVALERSPDVITAGALAP
jgi:hypothetical protein